MLLFGVCFVLLTSGGFTRGGAGVCAPPLNLPRGSAEGMQRGGGNFFSSVEFYL